MKAATPVQKDGPRVNEEIRVREVHLIDKDGANRGTVAAPEALRLAQEAGLDLVEIAPNADPPVCKLMDFGKYKYQEQKKAAEARKKQKVPVMPSHLLQPPFPPKVLDGINDKLKNVQLKSSPSRDRRIGEPG